MKQIQQTHVKILILIPIFLFYGSLGAISYYDNGETLTVMAEKGLNLRDKPSTNGKKVTQIPLSAQVKVLSKKETKTETIEGIKGYWIEVSFQKSKGYVFDGFLSRLPSPPKPCKSLKDYLTKTYGSSKLETISMGDYEGKSAYRYKQSILYMTEGGDTFDLYFPEISMEEMYLIGKLCKEFTGNTFTLDESNAFTAPSKNKPELMIRIYQDENGVTILRKDL
ncbi:SH3 domain protein [Leptospira yanagawae serovar Saopaulo str. Sao Paulo = ATCC 700523]|uniref:SH3 domain protein n=1 Tax=Leptospira yanagawae serovar Saopaulo str. Sao Paulo = ATCC 700523 TaxID=1249483 RepID=A0A5E8HBP5_9LEPT|nr:SH3 domain-containing protein [Leptospira yanagawae]EOQ88659.1 SH3 domain protein [Leptospira yanagawae serovar Saopaulo str. Sao Paulo = ATCC 700523]